MRGSSVNDIGLEELGHPGWDPLCFCSAEGLQYYFPALLRLALETAEQEAFYFEQLLFHLAYDGADNRLMQSCSVPQREFIAAFVEHMLAHYPERIEDYLCADEALRVHELWSCGSKDPKPDVNGDG